MSKISDIQWKLDVLQQRTTLGAFDCSDKDLNDFLLKAHLKQQAGCCFITVDAYQNALEFYKKNGFDFLTEKDALEQTRAMYLDLKAFV
jgi:hypothetical protein